MDAHLQRRVQRYGWDKASAGYEIGWREQLLPAQSRLIELATLRPGDAVLDVACGTGLVSFQALAVVGPSGRVVGTDISEGMIEQARAAATARGLSNASFLRMDAEALEFEDGRFDSALCALGLMYVPDPERAVCELYRVVRPGGCAAVAVWGQRDRCGWAEIFPIIDSRVASDVCPMFFRLGTGDALSQAFVQAGFTRVVIERIETRLHYASAEAACDAAFVGGPVALAYARFNDASKRAARVEYLASIEPFRDQSSYSIRGEFVVACGRRPD